MDVSSIRQVDTWRENTTLGAQHSMYPIVRVPSSFSLPYNVGLSTIITPTYLLFLD